mmetsp:Transcript_28182/g.45663  ORF Transcript_28182/g.45663 Transcript_28182/m.45663 type:complete len:281 (+) Transcript_28182:118-960(+)
MTAEGEESKVTGSSSSSGLQENDLIAHTPSASPPATRNRPFDRPTPISTDEDDSAVSFGKRPHGRRKSAAFWRFLCCVRTDDDPDSARPSKRDKQEKKYLLPPLIDSDRGKKTLVLDLDETLVHSSFKPIFNADIIIPVEIDQEVHPVYVLKRPGVDHFLRKMGEYFEIVIFTASLSKYADPLVDKLDVYNVVRGRLFREACEMCDGNYVKDLSKLGRELKSTIIVDNSPTSYMWHPANAVPIGSFIDDLSDRELYDLIPLLEAITDVDDVSKVLAADML